MLAATGLRLGRLGERAARGGECAPLCGEVLLCGASACVLETYTLSAAGLCITRLGDRASRGGELLCGEVPCCGCVLATYTLAAGLCTARLGDRADRGDDEGSVALT